MYNAGKKLVSDFRGYIPYSFFLTEREKKNQWALGCMNLLLENKKLMFESRPRYNRITLDIYSGFTKVYFKVKKLA